MNRKTSSCVYTAAFEEEGARRVVCVCGEEPAEEDVWGDGAVFCATVAAAIISLLALFDRDRESEKFPNAEWPRFYRAHETKG